MSSLDSDGMGPFWMTLGAGHWSGRIGNHWWICWLGRCPDIQRFSVINGFAELDTRTGSTILKGHVG
jgi:hypothetical protein